MTYVNAYAVPGIKECDKADLVSIDGKINRIIEKVCSYYGVTIQEMRSKSRVRKRVIPRQMCMYFLRNTLDLSLKEISELCGGRDHTTSIHSINLIKSQLELPVSNPIKSDYLQLIQII